jgi:hypothetical protein
MPTVGSPYSYSFEGAKTDVPLKVDAATGPEAANPKKEAKMYRRGRKSKKH